MKKETRIWTCKDGKKIRICDMTDSHLLNSIAFLEKYSEKVLSYEINACSSIVFQGEMAQDAQEDFLCSVTSDDYLPDIYENLCNEKLRRELK